MLSMAKETNKEKHSIKTSEIGAIKWTLEAAEGAEEE